jgi:hypothetical protein
MFPAAFRELLADQRLSPLGPGQPNRAAYPQLKALTLDSAIAPAKVRNPTLGRACLAGLWLYHDFLDEAHYDST